MVVIDRAVLGLGFISGLRTASGPALFARYAAANPESLRGTELEGLISERVELALKLGALGEFAIDKLPFIPARIEPGGLTARMISGACVGAAVSAVRGQDRVMGAMLGAMSAFTGAFVGYFVRRALTVGIGFPDPPIALLEDAVVLIGGFSLIDDLAARQESAQG
jgi:uncharacterized membrane protein